ncbi:hypothetical protein [Halalkalicoccus salilacus]
MLEERFGFETERASPAVPLATVVLIVLFVVGLLYRLVGTLL